MVAFLDSAAAVHFLGARNQALADWLAAADAPDLEEAFNPSLLTQALNAKDRLREAAGELSLSDARDALHRKADWTAATLGHGLQAGGELAGSAGPGAAWDFFMAVCGLLDFGTE